MMQIITRTLFEQPLGFLAIMLVAEIVLAAIWRERRTRGTARLLIVPAALAALVGVLSVLVVTDREQIRHACERIAADLSAGKTDGLQIYLDDDATIDLGPYGGIGLNKQMTILAAKGAVSRWNIRQIAITQFHVEFGHRAIVDLTTVMTIESPDVGRRRTPLTWRTRWLKRPAGWRIVSVSPPEQALGP